MVRYLAFFLGATLVCRPNLDAQSVLDRTPNVSGDWTGESGVVQFNFLHRFHATDVPTRKVISSPTLLLAAGLPARTLVGFTYSSNSILSSAYPNEWEFFGRIDRAVPGVGAPVRVGAQVGYNLAARGFDGELSAGYSVGLARLLAAGRVLADPATDGSDVAIAAGTVLKINRYLALSADAGTLTDRAPGEKVAWGVGLQLAILANTPHSLSLHVTNANNSTVQGSSRGTEDTRFGFEFTIPMTLRRYFGGGGTPAIQGPPPALQRIGKDTVSASIGDRRFNPDRIEITAGTTVVWHNTSQLTHTATGADNSFDTGLIEPGQRRAVQFTKPGTYSFHCMPHPFMTGVVVVR